MGFLFSPTRTITVIYISIKIPFSKLSHLPQPLHTHILLTPTLTTTPRTHPTTSLTQPNPIQPHNTTKTNNQQIPSISTKKNPPPTSPKPLPLSQPPQNPPEKPPNQHHSHTQPSTTTHRPKPTCLRTEIPPTNIHTYIHTYIASQPAPRAFRLQGTEQKTAHLPPLPDFYPLSAIETVWCRQLLFVPINFLFFIFFTLPASSSSPPRVLS